MKKLPIILILNIILSSVLFCQINYSADSLKTGSSYKFILYDDTEIIGKIRSQDSAYYIVTGSEGIYRIKKEDIFLVSRNLVKNKFIAMASLGGGMGFMNSDHRSYGGKEFKSVFSGQFSLLFPLSENKGIRFDAGYTRWEKEEEDFSYSENDFTKISARSNDYYYLEGDFVFGLIAPVNKFWIYGCAGLGIHIISENPYNYTYSYYLSYDSTSHTSSYFYPKNNFTSATLSIGGALGYRFTDRLGVYFDAQLNTVSYEGFFLFFWGGGRSYIPIRAGLTYIIY